MRTENELTRKMKDEVRKSENNILKALNVLSENPLRNDPNRPSAEITSDGKNTNSVQSASHGLDLDQENIDPNESFIGAEPNLHDTLHMSELTVNFNFLQGCELETRRAVALELFTTGKQKWKERKKTSVKTYCFSVGQSAKYGKVLAGGRSICFKALLFFAELYKNGTTPWVFESVPQISKLERV